jgi:hypothetical protein
MELENREPIPRETVAGSALSMLTKKPQAQQQRQKEDCRLTAKAVPGDY